MDVLNVVAGLYRIASVKKLAHLNVLLARRTKYFEKTETRKLSFWCQLQGWPHYVYLRSTNDSFTIEFRLLRRRKRNS